VAPAKYMTFNQAFPADSMSAFKQRVVHRLKALADESHSDRVVLPLGIFLLVDKAHGGDATAEELAARFKLLDFESRNVVDFYFLGWKRADPQHQNQSVQFDFNAFADCRLALQRAGVTKFGGNADLLLVDATYEAKKISLDFSQACRVDLSLAVAEDRVATLGGFLQSVIDAAAVVAQSRDAASRQGVTFAISDQLGLAIAKSSILDYILNTWGKIIGAKKLATVAVRSLGPTIDLADLT
jgi:hypothetical protein